MTLELSLKVKQVSIYSADSYCAEHELDTMLNNEGDMEGKADMALALAELLFSYRGRIINNEQINKNSSSG